jgi:hypothetical protein
MAPLFKALYDEFIRTPVDKRSFDLLNIQRVLSPQSRSALEPLFDITFTTEIGILPADGARVSLRACLTGSLTGS